MRNIFQEHVLTLRLWPGGGVSGFKHDFGSSRNSSFRPHGDIFGSWTSKGICFYILFRRGDSSYGFHDIMKKVCVVCTRSLVAGAGGNFDYYCLSSVRREVG